VVNGQINYKAPKPATVESGAQINAELNYTPIQGQQKDWNKGAWGLTVGWFIKLAGLILAGLLALWLFKRRSQEIVEHVIDDFGKNLLFGFIGLIVIPIAVILAFATVIGIIPAILTLLLYIVFLIIAGVFSGLIAGALIFKWVFKYKSLLNWKTVVAGIIVLQLITIIPVLGWLVMFILFLAAFGAILTLFYKRFLNR